jgi:hypothetical protein
MSIAYPLVPDDGVVDGDGCALTWQRVDRYRLSVACRRAPAEMRGDRRFSGLNWPPRIVYAIRTWSAVE